MGASHLVFSFRTFLPATAATAPAAHFRPGYGNGQRRREWRYRRRVCCCRGRSGDSGAGFGTRRRQRGHVRTAEGSHVQEEDGMRKMVAIDPGMYGDPPARATDQVGPSWSASTNKSASYTDQIRCLCNAPSVMIVGRFVLSLVLQYTRLCVCHFWKTGLFPLLS